MKVLSTRVWSRAGSVLAPVVGAMLILVLCGTALSEIFSAERHLSTLDNTSSQARWIAEAGLWHAASADQEISVPVSFAGGVYTVAKSGTVFTSTAVLGDATEVLVRDFAGAFEPAVDESSVLNVPATENSVTQVSNDAIEIELMNITGERLFLEAFELSADVPSPPLHWVRLEGIGVAHAHSNNDLPTGYWPVPFAAFLGNFFNPALPLTVQLEFITPPSGTVNYTLVLHFNGQDSVTLNFSVDW